MLSLKDARLQGAPRYFTGRPCKRGHVCERLTSIRACVECQRILISAYHVAHKQERTEAARARNRADRSKARAACRRYYAAHRESEKARTRTASLKWQREHPKEANARAARWRKRNRDKCNAKFARRRAAILKATPSWVDHAAINAIYTEAMRRTRATGIPHDVDHIVPLMGKHVRGLHVPWNLQVIPARENRRKSNKEMAC